MSDVTQPSSEHTPVVGAIPISSNTLATTAEVSRLADIRYLPSDGSDELLIPGSAQTLEGFRNWALSDEFPDRFKISFLNKELFVDMSPESIEEHNAIKTEICRVLANLARTQRVGRLFSDGILVTNESAGVSNEPDALFLTKETLRSGRVSFTPEKGRPQSSKEIVGTVDWVLEVVSPSSQRKDTKLLRDAYFKAGIREYWLIDVLGDEIDFQILVAGENSYAPVTPVNRWHWSPTFDRLFVLSREKDEDEIWEYTLEMKER